MSFAKFFILVLQILQVIGFVFSAFFLRRWYRQNAKIDLKRSTGWAFNTSCISFVLVLILAIAGTDSELLLAGIIQIMVLPAILVALLKGRLTI